MPGKTSKFYAILHAKCPHCRRGDIFTGSMYGWNIQHTKEICNYCGQRVEIEPGYFYAAMYVSYAMNVLEMLLATFITFQIVGPLEDNTFWTYLIVIFAGCFLFYPVNYRYSRLILLHVLSPNIKYKSYYDK